MNRFVTFLCVFVVVLGLAQLPSEMPWALRLLIVGGVCGLLGFVTSRLRRPEKPVVPKKKRILSILRAYAVFGLLFALVMPSIWHALAVSTMFALIPTMFIIWDPVPGDASSTLAKTLPGLIFVAFSLAATCIVPARRDLWWLAIVLVALGAGLGHVAWYMLRRPRHNLGTRA